MQNIVNPSSAVDLDLIVNFCAFSFSSSSGLFAGVSVSFGSSFFGGGVTQTSANRTDSLPTLSEEGNACLVFHSFVEVPQKTHFHSLET
jgi:hypothetical protein